MGEAGAAAHPALCAWRALCPADREPFAIETLQEGERGSRVYRLLPDGVGAAVIAKRCIRNAAVVERCVYERVLPEVGTAAAPFYGCVEEPAGDFCWLFVGELTGSPYRSHQHEERVAAARWLGNLHGAASRSGQARQLPDRSPDHYRGLLTSARSELRTCIADSAPDSRQQALLGVTLRHCERLHGDWGVLESLCSDGPQTLVHGDFVAHNVFMQARGSDPSVLVIDWEKAGWGTPAEDLSSVDLPAYAQAVRPHWPELPFESLQRLALAGRFFRCLVFLDWLMPRLEPGPGERPLDDLERCNAWLAALTDKL